MGMSRSAFFGNDCRQQKLQSSTVFKRFSQSPDHYAERQAIGDALASLRVLKRDSLGLPDWEKK
jgi:hypothetical protein